MKKKRLTKAESLWLANEKAHIAEILSDGCRLYVDTILALPSVQKSIRERLDAIPKHKAPKKGANR